MYEIVYAASVKQDIRKIDKQYHKKIKEEIEKLRNFPDVSQIKRLRSHPLADFRLRVGNFRILFDVDEEAKKIFILKIGHRKEVY